MVVFDGLFKRGVFRVPPEGVPIMRPAMNRLLSEACELLLPQPRVFDFIEEEKGADIAASPPI